MIVKEVLLATVAGLTALTVVWTGATAIDARYQKAGAYQPAGDYAPMSAVIELKEELKVGRIFDLVRDAQTLGASPLVCNAITYELLALCKERPSHYLCTEQGTRDLKAKSGCP